MRKRNWLSIVMCVVVLVGLMLPVTVRAEGALPRLPQPVLWDDNTQETPNRPARRPIPGNAEDVTDIFWNPNSTYVEPEQPNRPAPDPDLPDWYGNPNLPPAEKPDPDPDLPHWLDPNIQNDNSRPAPAPNPELDRVPRTGDSSGVTFFSTLAVLSMTAAAALTMQFKKKEF